MTKRRKKGDRGPRVVMLLGQLAHNVVVWAKRWLLVVSRRRLSVGAWCAASVPATAVTRVPRRHAYNGC